MGSGLAHQATTRHSDQNDADSLRYLASIKDDEWTLSQKDYIVPAA